MLVNFSKKMLFIIDQLYDISSNYNSMFGMCEGNFSEVSWFRGINSIESQLVRKEEKSQGSRSEFRSFIFEISELLDKDWNKTPSTILNALNDLWFEIENHLFEEAKKGSFDKNIPLNERVKAGLIFRQCFCYNQYPDR